MLTSEQLTRLREVCVDALYAASSVYKTAKAAAALADIDAELVAISKGTS